MVVFLYSQHYEIRFLCLSTEHIRNTIINQVKYANVYTKPNSDRNNMSLIYEIDNCKTTKFINGKQKYVQRYRQVLTS